MHGKGSHFCYAWCCYKTQVRGIFIDAEDGNRHNIATIIGRLYLLFRWPL